MVTKSVLLTLAVVLCLAQSSEAIKCYKCSSDRGGCGDENFKASEAQMTDCGIASPPADLINAQVPTKCSKLITSDAAGKRVSRDCHWQQNGTPATAVNCYVSPNARNLKIESCQTCTNDYCNSATSMQVATFSFLVIFAAFFMKMF